MGCRIDGQTGMQEKVSEKEEAKRGEATKYLSFLLLRSEERASERARLLLGGQWRVELPYQLCRPLRK